MKSQTVLVPDTALEPLKLAPSTKRVFLFLKQVRNFALAPFKFIAWSDRTLRRIVTGKERTFCDHSDRHRHNARVWHRILAPWAIISLLSFAAAAMWFVTHRSPANNKSTLTFAFTVAGMVSVPFAITLWVRYAPRGSVVKSTNDIKYPQYRRRV